MATDIFKQTMETLAEDYKSFRKETLNNLGEKNEGKGIEFTFKDYVTQYFQFLEFSDSFEPEDEEEFDEEEESDQEEESED